MRVLDAAKCSILVGKAEMGKGDKKGRGGCQDDKAVIVDGECQRLLMGVKI